MYWTDEPRTEIPWRILTEALSIVGGLISLFQFFVSDEVSAQWFSPLPEQVAAYGREFFGKRGDPISLWEALLLVAACAVLARAVIDLVSRGPNRAPVYHVKHFPKHFLAAVTIWYFWPAIPPAWWPIGAVLTFIVPALIGARRHASASGPGNAPPAPAGPFPTTGRLTATEVARRSTDTVDSAVVKITISQVAWDPEQGVLTENSLQLTHTRRAGRSSCTVRQSSRTLYPYPKRGPGMAQRPGVAGPGRGALPAGPAADRPRRPRLTTGEKENPER